MHPDLGGLYKTPVTYAYLCGTGLASGAALFLDRAHDLPLDLTMVTRYGQYWRLLTCHFGFQSGMSVAFGIYLIFHCRLIERQFGSKKFGSFVVLVLVLSTLLQAACLKAKVLPSIASGPYALIGALMVVFYGNVPKLQPELFSAMGLHLSEKASTYFMMILVCLRGLDSALPFGTGVLVGAVYQTTPLSKFRLPGFLVWFFELFASVFAVVPMSVAAQQRQRQLQEAQRRHAPAPNGQGFRDQLLPGMGGGMPMPVAAPPSDAAIETLTSLGFERDQAIAALRAADNNVEAAANRLLNGM
ncbi:hypothetical protein SDRG_12436 [Saprolegnia diclina VS20]|uniref:UBA domain-containing protein n=1 Tax=Saprolegnia diclina (strain VS20) TaxID=1156394 RepID=T0RJ23_SAPDV|nr:hypothetical protein SDRG_12436 [Saprolegnia diclina VS20]EQC29892.1 hypothetical protein SDRG_12436 [Saprolegnia diclina VS20]|eukprot:XP_008616731.1 hypothetical protein SDRG_12436 [Saprolegnia diclina VS20]